jgi:hypothetical protein
MFELLSLDCGESMAVKEDYLGVCKEISAAMLVEFEKRHGPEAITASSPADVLALSNIGMRGVLLSPALFAVISRGCPDSANARLVKGLAVTKTYSKEELSDAEVANVTWAIRKVYAAVKFNVSLLQIVDFTAKNIFGCYNVGTGAIRLAKSIINNPHELVATLVHEAAHKYGGDGSGEHRLAIERIFATIVCEYERSTVPAA